jgi:hypothetical protein
MKDPTSWVVRSQLRRSLDELNLWSMEVSAPPSLVAAHAHAVSALLLSAVGIQCLYQREGERGDHRVHRVATAVLWRTFSHEGKISPGW